MPSSNMDETNPISGEDTFMASGEIPIPTKTSPFRVTPLGITLPLHDHALDDIMSSMSPLTSSMWSRTVTPTSEPFMPQIQNMTVTSILTISIVCVASSAPTISAVTTYL